MNQTSDNEMDGRDNLWRTPPSISYQEIVLHFNEWPGLFANPDVINTLAESTHVKTKSLHSGKFWNIISGE